ncbi:MAG: thioredoxin domain-containing protein [Bacteroidia bacterium]|nr:thioredoxin domain-containing protein [Bacteroidia bacterium]
MTNTPNKQANRLIHSSSPYLLQHAYNPVDWFEWGNEALAKAKHEDKPILVSIGYSACHWCHVMERESFEVDDIAQIMNEYFVCIKVDREERPDIDHVYMEAVQAMGMNGGWPLNVFLTPDQKPFYGGTYFPPKNWAQMLLQLNKAFHQKRAEINSSADELIQHLSTSDLKRFAKEPGMDKFTIENLDSMFTILASRFDATWGGIEKAPKFVMPTIWLLLLRYHALSNNKEALHMVSHTLTKMAMGGLYDQIGGGFSRYSVDREWFAPHFEKMLYDNAQLLSLYAEAYSLTKNESFKAVVTETFDWLRREMTHSNGGFYSALDADSEGVEGKFYTWPFAELEEVLQKEIHIAKDYFQATSEGNWEHGRNILHRKDDSVAPPKLKEIKAKLFHVRAPRIRPGLDDKILTGWNAMMVQGLIDSYKAFSEISFLDQALKTISFLEANLIQTEKIYRTFKNKRSDTEGFLEDYALLIQAYTSLYQVTFNEEWLLKAERWSTYVLTHFYDVNEGYFHFSSSGAEQLVAKKKEIFDNVIPSSNSVMARNLFHLGILLDNDKWKEIATNMSAQLASLTASEPGNMSNWGVLFSEITHGLAEVAIVGNDAEHIRKKLHRHPLPFALLVGTKTKSDLSVLQGRDSKNGKTLIYVCFNKTCKLPVATVEAALEQLI